ncbi:hypothetical protein JKP88DRAFT_314497 [Tribonema minus]|uniref:Uncharacterized protein n=1 Tax=Tribonema minus TaxID=303371 RepID=A0A835YZB0_9STRA|nr:hypothetical protein JKP88DRAFT_314497 [Tribonema minus]
MARQVHQCDPYDQLPRLYKARQNWHQRAAATGLLEFKQLRAHAYPLWKHSGVLRNSLDACSDVESPIRVPVLVADEPEARHFEEMLWVLYHNTLPDPGSLELERALGILRAADKFAVEKRTTGTSVAHESSIACLLINWAKAHELATVPDELALRIRARYLDVLHMAALTEFFPQWTPQFIAHCAASQRQLDSPMHSNAPKLDTHDAVLSLFSATAIYASLKTPRRAKSTVTAAAFTRTVKMEDIAAAFASAMQAHAAKHIAPSTPIINYFGGYKWCLCLIAHYHEDRSITLGAYVQHKLAVPAAASVVSLVGAKYTIKCLSQPGSDDVSQRDAATIIPPLGRGWCDILRAMPKLTTWDASAFAQWRDSSQDTRTFEVTVETACASVSAHCS